jgi:hypothetical protein
MYIGIVLMCVDCVLSSLRIAQADPGRRTLPRGGSVTKRDQVIVTMHTSKLKTRHISIRTRSLQRKIKIQELTDLWDYLHCSSEDSTQLSTLDRASPTLPPINQNLFKWRTTNRVWCVDFHHVGVFIAMIGTSTDLEK